MTGPRFILPIGWSVLVLHEHGATLTLRGGQTVESVPEDNDAYRATAERLGYGSDTLRMCQDHEAAHVALCELLGLPESPVMRAVVEGLPSELAHGLEEDAVMALQAFANAVGVDLWRRLVVLAGRVG